MVAIDYGDIADGIASQFSAITAPTGEAALKDVTADLPDSLSTFPVILIVGPEEEYVYPPGGLVVVMDWDVLLIIGKHDDLKRRTRRLLNWRTQMQRAFETSIQIGLPTYVSYAQIAEGRVGRIPYEGVEYDGVSMVVRVHVTADFTAVEP